MVMGGCLNSCLLIMVKDLVTLLKLSDLRYYGFAEQLLFKTVLLVGQYKPTISEPGSPP